MAVNVGNPLIAALRGNTQPQGGMPSGPQALKFAWQSNSEGPLVMPNRNVPNPTTPRPPPAQPPVQPPVQPPSPPVVPPTPPFPPGNKSWPPPDLPQPPVPPTPPTPTREILPDGETGEPDRPRQPDVPPTEPRPVVQPWQPDVEPPAPPVPPVVTPPPAPPPPPPRQPVVEPDVRPPRRQVEPEPSVRETLEDILAQEEPPPPPPAAPAAPVVTPPPPAPEPPLPIAAVSPVTDERSVRQTLEQILADPAPQVVTPPAPEPLPPDVNISAFDSGINFEMPDMWFSTPAPFVEGFTPDADVAAAMQAQGTLPAPVTQPETEPQYIDPAVLAMLEMPQAPQPAQQPVVEEPLYADVPWWMMDGGFDFR